MKHITALFMAIILSACSSGNLQDVKDVAGERWSSLGFDVIGYDGYQWGFWGFNDYGGAKVWHMLKKSGEPNGITYNGYLQKWGDEYHMYDLSAVDAIRP